jgi:formamidopyrimidine-DNA glycosylase
MPELPDLTVYVEALERRIVGTTLESVRIVNPFLLRSTTPTPDEFQNTVVIAVSRLGKRIILEFERELLMILHRARLSPFKKSSHLAEDEVERLFDATTHVLEEWTNRLRREAGDEFPERITAFRDGMAVHGRFGQPCPDCGAPVQRIVFAETEANYCPGCQTGRRILADRSLSRLLKADWPRTLDDLERLDSSKRN